MTASITIVPGMTVKVFDPHEPQSEWLDFIVEELREQQVFLLSLNGEKTWAWIEEIILPNPAMLAFAKA